MRILVVSDTHGDLRSLIKAVAAQRKAEIIVHCGDGEEQQRFLKDNYKDKMIVAVRGGKTIFVTHGHLYDAKSGLYRITSAAREAGADILLFGHTHMPLTLYEDGLYIMNPGSCHGYYASYGIIDITDNGEIVTNTVALK